MTDRPPTAPEGRTPEGPVVPEGDEPYPALREDHDLSPQELAIREGLQKRFPGLRQIEEVLGVEGMGLEGMSPAVRHENREET